MFNPFRAKRDREAREREQFLLALTEIAKHFANGARAQADSVAKLAEATAAQAGAFQSYFDMFSVTGATTSRVMRDEDEFNAELERSGFPIHDSAETQMQWVLKQTE